MIHRGICRWFRAKTLLLQALFAEEGGASGFLEIDRQEKTRKRQQTCSGLRRAALWIVVEREIRLYETLKMFIPIAVMSATFLLASRTVYQARSEPATTNLVAVSAMPTTGTFWSMQLTNRPPFPCNPFPNLPLYTDGTPGNYYYDDLGIDYSALWAAINPASAGPGGGVVTADDGLPWPGGGGSGSTSVVLPSYTITSNCQNWTNFFLVISNTGNAALVGIESTLAGTTYNLQTNSDLSTTNWGVYETLYATSSITWANPLSFTASSNMFFRARIIWPTVLWITPLSCIGDQWGNGLDGSPALSVDGSNVYIASSGNFLYALDAGTGTIKESNAVMTQSAELTPSANNGCSSRVIGYVLFNLNPAVVI